MTRAKNHLFLFSCVKRDSAFVRELQLPVETPEPDDVFVALPTELCGKPYHHAEKGRGTIAAACDGRCMIAYPDGEMQVLTVGQMFDQRLILRKIRPASVRDESPKAANATKRIGAKAALSKAEKAALIEGATRGRKVVHVKFGEGRIVGYADQIVTVIFPDWGKK